MKLRFLGVTVPVYHSHLVEVWNPDEERDMPDDLAAYLLDSFPADFEEVKPPKLKRASTGGPKKATKPAKGKEK